MTLQDLAALEGAAKRLEELIHVCRKFGRISCENPELTANVTRKAKALRTSLKALHDFLLKPKEPRKEGT